MRFCLFLILLIPVFCLGQDNSGKVFSLKPSLGINGCQVHGDSYSGYDKIGLFGGLAGNALLSDKFSLELGFYFSQKGARHNQNPKIGDFTFYRLNLNYIEMPLSLRFRFHKDYFATAGPSFAYLINFTEERDNYDISMYSDFNRTELGVNIGIGRRITDKIMLELRSGNSILAVRNVSGNLIYYTNPVARFFNKGYYNNILTLFATIKLGQNKQRAE